MKVRRDLTFIQAAMLYGFLSGQCENGKLKRGSYAKAAKEFQIHFKTASRLWKRVSERAEGVTVEEALKKKYTGSDPSLSQEELSKALREVPLIKRQSIRSAAFACNISNTTFYRALKRGSVVKKRSYVKPLLTEFNCLERMRFSLSHIKDHIRTLPFDDMHNVVHIDEKWFNLTQIKQSYYMAPDEILPNRNVKSKRFITKVMFLSAVARPRYDHRTKTHFNGKIGIWPFVQDVAAQRNSRNRPAGTIEKKPLNVTADVFEEYLITKVIPAIKQKWVGRRSTAILIQQDNARPHSKGAEKNINAAGQSDGWNIRMLNQPANSPDLNILDLGFFNAIQSLQAQKCAYNIEDLIAAVEESFEELSSTSLHDNFITLQSVMREILFYEGSNDFKIPHLDKSGNRKRGTEISRLHCPVNLYKKARKYIASKEKK